MADEKSPLDLATDLLVYAPVGLALAAGELLPELIDRGRAYLGGQVPMARVVGQMAVRQGQTEASKVVDQALGQVGVVLEHLLRSWATGGQGPAQPPASAGSSDAPTAAPPTAPTAAPPTAATAPPTTATAPPTTATAPPTAPTAAPPAATASPAAPPSSGPTAASPASATSPPSPTPPAPPSTGGPGSPTASAASASPASTDREPPGVGDLAIADYESLSASQVLPRLTGLSADDLDAVRRYEEAHRRRRTVLGRIESLQGSP